MKNIFSLLLIATCIANAYAVPQTPRHNKILYVKQTIYNDYVCTNAAITQPGVIGNTTRTDNIDYMRQDMGAQFIQNGVPCPHAGSSPMPTTTDFTPIGRVDYAGLKARLEELYQYEQTMRAAYSTPSSNCYYYDQCNNYDFKSYINSAYGTNPAYFLAVKVRETATDYSTLTEETARIATDYNMNNTVEATAFRNSVQAYLLAHKISTAFIDVETEFTLSGATVKRAAATLTIDMNDVAGTKGTYSGTTIVNTPNAAAGTPLYRNTINISYTTASQYPDFYNLNTALLDDRSSSYGKIEWTVPSPIDPVMAVSSVDTLGVYDPSFPGTQQIKNLLSPTAPAVVDKVMRSIQNIYPAQEPNTVKCIMTGDAGCNTNADSVQSIMTKNNAHVGTFTFYGRWEIKPRVVGGKIQSDPPEVVINETRRGLEYDVCKPVKFWNTLSVNYTVQRYKWTYDVMMDPIQGFKYRLAGAAIMDKEVSTTTPTVYDSSGLLKFGRDIQPTDYVERTLMADKSIIDPTKWTISHDSVVASKVFTDPNTGAPVASWAPAMAAYATTQIYRAVDLPNGAYPYIDAQARTAHFNCYAINEDTIASYFAKQCVMGGGTGGGGSTGVITGSFKGDNTKPFTSLIKTASSNLKNPLIKTQATSGLTEGCVIPGTIAITPGNNNGDVCTIQFASYASAVPGKIVFNTSNLPNNACTESCEIGATPSPICPRPRNEDGSAGSGAYTGGGTGTGGGSGGSGGSGAYGGGGWSGGGD